MSNIRTIEHTINLIAEFDTDKMPAHIAYMMMKYNEEQLNSVLAQTFIATLEHIGAFDKINENNVYATIKAGKN
jgi:hypothetical protein